MKFKIDKATFDALNDAQKALYAVQADGSYQLTVEGLPSPEEMNGLKAKMQELLDEKKTESDKRKQAEETARQAEETARLAEAKKKGDFDALEKSWQDKHAREMEAVGVRNKTLESSLRKVLIDNKATELASRLAGTEAVVLLPHISSRLDVEERDGGFVTVVRGPDGKPSALTLDDLGNEFVGNKAFASLIKVSQGNGGGAQGGSGGSNSAKQIKRADFDRLDPMDRASKMKEGVTVVD